MALEQIDLSRMLETAIVAARLAGQRAMEEINFVKASIKNETDYVTEADTRCQRIIIDRIKETYPDHGFIAEEGTGGGIFKLPPRTAEPIWWVIDPIDGTTNFVHRIPLLAVSIAVMYEGRPVVGVVFEPATDSMFTVVEGREAQRNGRRITASEQPISKLESIGLDSHYDDGVPGWACEIMKRTRFRNLGTTAMHFAYVANGGFIAAIVNKPKLWDVAAGALLVEVAGGIVTDWQGNKIFPFDIDNYNGEELRVLTASKKVHPELLNLIS